MSEFKKPLISLIITCHNLGEYLPQCVKSIENQTYKNFEIIIVDDFSDEKTKEIIEKNFKNKNIVFRFLNSNEIRVIETKKNEGQLASFLLGLKVARGEFICMIDADDVLLEDYLATHLQVHMRTNVAFTSANVCEIDENSTLHSLASLSFPMFENKQMKLKKEKVADIFNICADEFEVKILNLKNTPFGTWAWAPSTSAMMRKSALEFLLLFKETEHYKTGADKFIFSFLHLIGGSALISQTLYAYRRHSANQSESNPLTGNFRYLKSSQIKRIINWNKMIRLDTLFFIKNNYSYFCARLNPMNVKRLIFNIIFSFNFSTIKKALKALIFKFC